MEKEKTKIFFPFGLTILPLIAGLVGYFVFGGLSGLLATGAFAFLLGLLKYIGLIPCIGALLFIAISFIWFIPIWMSLTGIYWTWWLAVIYIFYVTGSFVYTIASTTILITKLK